MDSEALRTELPRLLAAATALFTGVGTAIAIRSLLHRGDGGGVRRSIAAMIVTSAAAAFGAGFFVYSARLGYLAQYTLAYAATGFAAGLLTGLFPLFAGIPLFVLAAVSTIAVVSSVAPASVWVDGAQAARFTVYSATDTATVCGASIEGSGPLAGTRDLTLPPGPITLETGIFDIRGPYSAIVGTRRYRLEAIRVGGRRIQPDPDDERRAVSPAAEWYLRLLGCRYRMVVSDSFLPEDMLSADLVLEADGKIRLDVR